MNSNRNPYRCFFNVHDTDRVLNNNLIPYWNRLCLIFCFHLEDELMQRKVLECKTLRLHLMTVEHTLEIFLSLFNVFVAIRTAI